MTTFFQAQMDYIFFFYGLAFIGLGVVAYILSKEVDQRLPWGWLALFGFTRGVKVWLDLMALVWGDGVWFAALRWAIMAASFLCLVEFGRLSLMRRRSRGPGRWLLAVLALAVGLGGMSGWSGLNATTRYFLGLVGSLGAGWALFAEARQSDSKCRLSLLAGSVGFILYGLATVVVVPQAGFFPANTLNYATFTSLTGLPIQLVRGLLAVWIAAMIMGYFQVAQSEGDERRHRYRARYLYVVVAALAVILAGGWFLTQSLGDLAGQQVRKDSLVHNQLAIQRLTLELEQAEEAVRAMSGSPWISPVLESGSRQTLAQANAVLDRYQQRFGAAVAYLMDASGATIASSNRGDPDSFVGKKYAFRPYFQDAMAGNAGRYFALGVTSKKRGFYASYPVQDPAGKILGVAVFKMTLNRFQKELGEFDPAFLIDPHGIVFVASRPDLDYHSLWPLVVTDPGGFMIQYGTDRFTPIFSQPLVDEARVEFAGKGYMVTRQNIAEVMPLGWALVNLEPLSPVLHYRLMGIGAAFILVFLTLVFAGTNLSIREGANRIMASEARFRTMFAAAPEAVFVLDPETRRIIGANPFMAQWLGYGPEELVGLEIDQVRAPDSLEPQSEDAGEDSTGPHLSPSPRYRKKDGSLVDVECTEANILHGDQTRKIVFVRDITARRQAENEVRQAKEYLENILENSADPIGIVDQRGRIIQWNKAAEQVFGYSFQELEGMSSFELYADRKQLEKMLSQLRRTGSVNGYEIRMNKRDGSVALFALSISLLYDRHHKVIGSVSVARNLSEIKKALNDLATVNQQLQHEVTERKQMEAAIQETSRGLQTILDNVQTGVLIIDPETHVIVDANPVAVGLFGAPKDQIVGSECSRFICRPEHGKCAVTDMGETVVNAERVLQRADGGNLWVMQTVVKVSLQGKERLLESFVDITERRQWEEAIQTTNDKLHTLVAQVNERNRTMTQANEMSDMIQACEVSEEAYKTIGLFLPNLFPDDAGALYMLNNSRNLYETVASWGLDSLAVPVFAPDECWSVRRGRLHKVENPQEALCCPHVAEAVPGGYLCVPLIAQGETLGVLHLRPGPPAAAQPPALADVKDQLALTVAEDLALALANLRLRETLRNQAIRDPLTGLFNRRYLEETMERELTRVKRQGVPLGVIMMDLDHFKQYNDTFGHSAGDELLSALGILLKTHIRGEDIACRYGGEEFMLILPGASMEIALERAEDLRQAVKEMHQHYPGLKPTSLSLGVAVYPDHGDTGLHLIQSADVALYRAKRAGRDRVVAAEYAEETITAAPPAAPLQQTKIS
ncbi:MAG: diguanylate cyclase [Deltaproteobacteria bacterium]|nr:diguanylate cyclase [Deltaproteobacteria bacterium]